MAVSTIELQTLMGLSTERLTRLVEQLERSPDINVTVGSWLPQCPMVLAGFDHEHASACAPEREFANVWDQFAAGAPRRRSRWVPLFPVSADRPRNARRRHCQALLRTANAVLAARVQSPSFRGGAACSSTQRPPLPFGEQHAGAAALLRRSS